MKQEILLSTKKEQSAIDYKLTTQKGFSIIEVLLAGSLFILFVTALVGAFIYSKESAAVSGNRSQSISLAEEGIEAARAIRDNNWDDLVVGDHGLAISPQGYWTLSGSSDTTDKFTRVITVESIDQNRKKITSKINWQLGEREPREVKLITYLDNWGKILVPHLIQSHYRWRYDDGGE